ncbi:MAG: hypothetical protein FWF20_07015 [Betaproteobacteria bacterium]|nr:hypothetical protein [Betaproteobacteria bacterium]MCL2886519.1 hypothetical protein [Betaproteobacteria bacterium]
MSEVHTIPVKVKMDSAGYTARVAGAGYRASSTQSAAIAVLRAAEKHLDGSMWDLLRPPEHIATPEYGRELWQIVVGKKP